MNKKFIVRKALPKEETTVTITLRLEQDIYSRFGELSKKSP